MRWIVAASDSQVRARKARAFSAMICLAMTCLVVCVARPAADGEESRVKNSGFEEVEAGRFKGWQVTCEPDQVKPRVVAGVWQSLTCEIENVEGEDSVNFYFFMNTGSTGSIWIDNVSISPEAPMTNLSFEDTGEDGAPVGWKYDKKGTIFSDATRSSDGEKSVRITHRDGTLPISLIWQNIPLEDGKEYSLSFDYFVSDDFVGTAKGYVFDHTSSFTRQKNPEGTRVVGARAQCEKVVAALTPAKGSPVDVHQRISVTPGMNFEASVEANTPKLNGDVTLIVEDAASEKVLGQATLSEAKKKWRTLSVPFQSRSSEIVLHVVARGQGEVEVDNAAITPPQPVPPLQDVEWLPASENFPVPSTLKVSIQGDSGKVLEQGLSMLAGDLAALSDVTVDTVESGDAPVTIAIGPDHALADKGDESYSLEIDEQGIRIQAGTEAGAFYGLMTVLQLLRVGDGAPVAVACRAQDYPDMPMRGVLYGDPEQAARWKMNTLMLSTGYPVEPADREDLHEFVSKCERLNLDVIPYFLSLAGGYYVQQTNPYLAAGIQVKDEKIPLKGTQPSPLANPFVIRAELTDVKLTSADGKTRYRLGKDYEVIDGDISYPYNQKDPQAFAVVRTPGSSIPDGATVLAGYDFVSQYRKSTNRTDSHIPYCPLEPEVRRLMGDYMKNLAKDFPISYINTAHCLAEFRPAEGQLATDSRVIASGKTPIELLADDVCSLDQAAKTGRADVRILQWAGEVNEYCRQAGPKLPKDALINVWGYEPLWAITEGRAALTFWSELGFTTSVMPWYDLTNVRAWAQVVAEARRRGYPCIGMIDSCWESCSDPTGGVEETAIVSWKIPRKGDRRFVELPPLGPEEK